jgi:hypothetical protein
MTDLLDHLGHPIEAPVPRRRRWPLLTFGIVGIVICYVWLAFVIWHHGFDRGRTRGYSEAMYQRAPYQGDPDWMVRPGREGSTGRAL